MDDAGPGIGARAGSHAGFRDPAMLTKWTRVFLYAGIALAFVSLWELAGGPQMGGAEGSPEGWTAAAIIRFLAEITVVLTTAILVLTWTYRANYNARQLGAADMRFTPGWAVGWHFIPIAWFWKPYQAMTEIWRASVSPSDWGAVPVSHLLRWWWGLWIVTVWGLGAISDLEATGILNEAGMETVGAAADLVGYALDIPRNLVLVAIIGAVSRMQAAHHQSQSEA